MKLLFDQNLSPSLVKRLADLFPESSHTEFAGLAQKDDRSIWQYCLQERFVVVSKDNDFPLGPYRKCRVEPATCRKLH